jgi:hypothetical protein
MHVQKTRIFYHVMIVLLVELRLRSTLHVVHNANLESKAVRIFQLAQNGEL